jgi:hypothetical protein
VDYCLYHSLAGSTELEAASAVELWCWIMSQVTEGVEARNVRFWCRRANLPQEGTGCMSIASCRQNGIRTGSSTRNCLHWPHTTWMCDAAVLADPPEPGLVGEVAYRMMFHASELYRPSERHFSAKLAATFADGGVSHGQCGRSPRP